MVLQLENITKSFGANIVLEDINIKILSKTRYGFIGSNGAGKSTLLKLICKEIFPDTGNIFYSKDIKIGFLKQDSGLNHDSIVYDEMKTVFHHLFDIEKQLKTLADKLSVLEVDTELYEEVSNNYNNLQSYFEINEGYSIDVKIKTILNGMGFEEDKYNSEISSLSGGEKTRLAMAKLLLEEPNLLILDEPTNHLDFKTLNWLEDYLQEYKNTLMVVSHDRYFLDKVTNATIDLANNKIKSYKGNYSKYLVLKNEDEERHLKEYLEQQEDIAKKEEYIAKNIARKSTSKMAKGRRKALERMELIPPPERKDKKIKLNFKTTLKPYYDLLTIDNIDISVGEKNEVQLCENINLSIKRNDKVAIVGDNGIGKSTLIKIIQNLHPHNKGIITWGEGVKIGYFEQETRDLDESKTVIDELWDRFKHITELEIRNTLASVGIVGEEVFKKVSVLSGGEKAKVKFCILSLQPSNVLIMDEPTNHLDIDAKTVLEDALVDYVGTLLFISHDRYLLNKVPDKIIEITSNGAKEHLGNYDYYNSIKKQQLEEKKFVNDNIKNLEEIKKNQSDQYKTKEQRRKDAEKRNEVNDIEKTIGKLEQSVDFFEKEIIKEEIYSDYKLVHEYTAKIEKEKKQIDKLFSQWTELSKE